MSGQKSGGNQKSERITFGEFSDFDIPESGGLDRGHGMPHAQDRSMYYGHDMEPQYRSIAVSRSTQFPSSNLSEPLQSVGHVPQKESQLPRNKVEGSDVILGSLLHGETLKPAVNIPDKPRYVGPSHIICNLALDEVIARINIQLAAIHEVTFSFDTEKLTWNAVYLYGAVRCELEISLYKDSEAFLVHANRLSGDGMAFNNVFSSLKRALKATPASPPSPASDPDGWYMPLPPMEPLLQDEALEALRPIIAMAKCSMMDSRTESAKILCDLSSQMDLHPLMSDSGCVVALVGLIKEDYQYCNQHALCALANLSASLCCREQLVADSAFLTDLLELTRDGSYSCTEMRRECARMLANLSEGQAPTIVDAVGVDQASSWMRSVDTMRDDRLRLHAERAKKFLQPCI